MKKINLIIALSVITMGATIPASILISNNQSVLNNKSISQDSINDVQLIDDNDVNICNETNGSKIVEEIINANDPNCFAEDDTTKNANEWMGITGVEFVKFTITKDWVNASDVGTVSVSGTSAKTIDSTKLIIPSYIINNGNRYDVISIGTEAFAECINLLALDLVNSTSLANIGESAFRNCFNLTGELIISRHINNIEKGAFYKTTFAQINVVAENTKYSKATNLGSNCQAIINKTDGIFTSDAIIAGSLAMGEIKIPNDMTIIGNDAFRDCSRLTGALIIPPHVTMIGDFAFYDCSGLIGTLTIPNGVLNIGQSAFRYCASFNGNLIIPASVIMIGFGVFMGCIGFTSLDLEKATQLTGISSSTFNGCTGLTGTLTIPSGIKTIVNGSQGNNGAFQNCSNLTDLDLSKATSLQTIGASAFKNCFSLKNVNLSKATNLLTIGTFAFANCLNLTNTLTIPNSVTTIGGEAFNGCNFSEIFFWTSPINFTDLNIFGINNSTILINVPKISKNEWLSTSNILGKLGIASLDQIVEPVTPPASILPITLDKEGPYILDSTSSNVVKASSSVLPAEASQDINWTITTKDQITKPDNINIDNNGQVTIEATNGLAPIKYDLTIKATCPTDANITQYKDIQIYICAFDVITFDKNGPYYVKNNDSLTNVVKANVNLLPETTIQNIVWSIKNADNTNAFDWIKIDSTTGQITTTNLSSVTPNEYNFTITASAKDNSSIVISKNIQLFIVKIASVTFKDTSPKISIQNNVIDKKIINEAISNIEPKENGLSIQWSIKQTNGTLAPNWISIDQSTGEIFVQNLDTSQLGEYTFKVIASCSGDLNIFSSADICVEIFDPNQPQPTNSFPWWAILASTVVGATLLVIAIITPLLIKKRNKK